MNYRLPVAGILLAASVPAAVSAAFGFLSPLVAGGLQVGSAVFLWRDISSGVRKLSYFLLVLGFACFSVDPGKIFSAAPLVKNHSMIAMLAAIGTLRLAAASVLEKSPPVGRKALWQTVFGVHWLGSFINVSALVIFGDKLSFPRNMTPFQGTVLTRGFALAALWSPFFVAMGVALTYAPGAHFSTLILWGLPLSQLILVVFLCYSTCRSPGEVEAFAGYPFRIDTLLGPLFLTGSVMAGHHFFPAVSIVALITLLAPLYVVIVNMRKCNLPQLSFEYIVRDLPKMGPEVVLFLGAGFLAAALAAVVNHLNPVLPIDVPHILIVVTGLALILFLSSLGAHPVVGISLVGAVLSTMNVHPDLLAMSFLMGWGLGVLINPISGIHLLLSGRYGYSTRQVWRQNAPFVLAAFVFCWVWMGIFDFSNGPALVAP